MGERRADGQESLLEKQHAIALLRFLYDNPESRAYRLREVTGNYSKIVQFVAKDLEKAGLIKVIIEERPRLTYIYDLTPKGRKVVEKLKEIEGLMEKEG